MESHSAKKTSGMVKYIARCLIEFSKQIESLQYRNKSLIKKDDVGIDSNSCIEIVKSNINITYEYVTDDTGIIFSQLLRLKNYIVKLLTMCTEQNIYVNYDPSEIHNVLYSHLNNSARTVIANYLTIHLIDFVEYIIFAISICKREQIEETPSEIKKKFSTIYKTLKNLHSLPAITNNDERFAKSLDTSQFCSELLNKLLMLNKYIRKFNRAYLKNISNTDSADDKKCADEKVKKSPVVGVDNNSFKLPEFFENTRVNTSAAEQQLLNTTGLVEEDALTNFSSNLEDKKQDRVDSNNVEKDEKGKRKKNYESFKLSDSENKIDLAKDEEENTNRKKVISSKKRKHELSESEEAKTEQALIEDEPKKRKQKSSISESSDLAESPKKLKIDQKTEKTSSDKIKSKRFINTTSESDDQVLLTENEGKKNVKSSEKSKKEKKTIENKISKRRITLNKSNISPELDRSDEDDTTKSKKREKTGREKKLMTQLVKNVKTETYKNPKSEMIDSVDILQAIESGEIAIDYEEDEFDDLINTIKLNDLTDNERFLYIQEFVTGVEEKFALTDKLKEKLNLLDIEVDWEIPPAHQIAARLSAVPTPEEKAELTKIGITYGGKFTVAETEIVKKNWEEFSQKYKFPDPKPFLSFYYGQKKTVFEFTQRKRFVQFLGKDLPHKALYSIYKKFKTLYTNKTVKMGRFSPEEDLLIMTYMKSVKGTAQRNKFSKLAPVMNRERSQIERRYKTIKDMGLQKVTWTLERNETLLQHLLDEINSENINDLRNIPFDHPAFIYAATKMEMNPRNLKYHFIFQLSSRLFSQTTLYTSKIKVKIIERLIEKKAHDWKEVDWKSLAEEYEGIAPQFLWYMMKTTIRYVPKQYHENLKFCLRFLKEYYIPNLKSSKMYEHKHLKRLKWVNGKLQEYL